MGKTGNWFIAVKKALHPESKEKKDQGSNKSKKKWFGKQKHHEPIAPSVETGTAPSAPSTHPPPPPPPPPHPPHPKPHFEELKLTEAENEQNQQVYSVELATAVADEAAAEVVPPTTEVQLFGKSEEEMAAIKIQTAFRGYLARRALRALRGLVRLKSLVDGYTVKRQATTTLRSMQTLARVQSQIRARRIRIAQSKEQIEANLLNKQDAAMRRERALAYAFTRQQMWKNASRSTTPTYMDPNHPHWGWSWLERWMAARPWESRSMTEREYKESNDRASVRSASRSVGGGEISKSYARQELNTERPSPTAQKASRPPSRQSPSTPTSKAASSSSAAGKLKSASTRGNMWIQDDDSKSMVSTQSGRPRRHSVAGSSVRDDDSPASSPSVPSYMTPTESVRAKARLHSPLGVEKNGTPERGSAGSAKKRLSFPASPVGPRRNSGPPKIDSSFIKDTGSNIERVASNGGGG
ncbi:hypothetical protein NE237_010977 [Protea cynaroides]|uniref:DUF4005 domain-containing protein n=1 Tax=Protea cynaroides TaxID=273540 RepID=A0A9Q0L0E4_9MAGN|nr:hypothetical protein NE237_010977 [Protea cynaroides]